MARVAPKSRSILPVYYLCLLIQVGLIGGATYQYTQHVYRCVPPPKFALDVKEEFDPSTLKVSLSAKAVSTPVPENVTLYINSDDENWIRSFTTLYPAGASEFQFGVTVANKFREQATQVRLSITSEVAEIDGPPIIVNLPRSIPLTLIAEQPPKLTMSDSTFFVRFRLNGPLPPGGVTIKAVNDDWFEARPATIQETGEMQFQIIAAPRPEPRAVTLRFERPANVHFTRPDPLQFFMVLPANGMEAVISRPPIRREETPLANTNQPNVLAKVQDNRATSPTLAADLRAQSVTLPDGDVTLVEVTQSGVPKRRWCTVQGTPIKSDRRVNSETIGTLDYMEIVYVAHGYPGSERGLGETLDDDEAWCLVVQPKQENYEQVDKYRGWVQRRYLLESEKAVKDPRTKINKKVCVVVKDDTNLEVVGELVKPMISPAEDVEGAYPIRLFDVYQVYAEMRFSVKGVSENWVLIGGQPSFGYNNDSTLLKEKVIGWVQESRLARWDTREAAEWDRTTIGKNAIVPTPRPFPGALFRSADDAIDALLQKVITKSDPGGGKTDEFEPVDRPIAANSLRFQVLMSGSNISAPEPWSPDGNELFELGTVVGIGADAENFRDAQEATLHLAQQVSNTEVVFVIANTLSMKAWFTTVAASIRKIIDHYRIGQSRGNLKVGLTFYNVEGTEGRDPVRVEPLRLIFSAEDPDERRNATNLAQILETLSTMQEFGGGDAREQLFHGIRRAAVQSEFSPNARKVMFIIGDTGDKFPQRIDEECRTISRILVPSDGELCLVHVLQVNNKGYAENEEFRTHLESRLRAEYTKRFQMRFPEAKGIDAGDFFTFSELRGVEDIESRVLPAVAAAQSKGDTFRRLLIRASQGTLTQAEIAVAGPEFMRLYRREVQDFLMRGGTIYQKRYVWQNCPDGNRPQLRRMLFLSQAEIENAVQFIQTYEENLRNAPKENTITPEKILEELLVKMVGEEDKELNSDAVKPERIKEYLDALSFRSQLLHQFANKRRKFIFQSERERLLMTAVLLQDILDDQKPEPDKYEIDRSEIGFPKVKRRIGPDGQPYPKEREVRGFNRFGVRWFYIDALTEWP